MAEFDGKCVIVTGGASGFGTAIAERFADAGAGVVVADLNRAGAEAVAAELPNAIAVELDVADEAGNAALAAAAVAAFGQIDVVCANAGVPHLTSPMVDMATEDFDCMFAINVRSVFLAAKYCVPHMSEGGSLISTSSIGAKRPRPGLTPYNASKGAVNILTRGLAAELAPRIRVNAVCPVSAPTGFDKNAVGLAELPDEAN
ncbi:MAG: SDR family NAD(P)-dependent oxidoreductase, partial [Pseudomonadota bacterium]